MTTDTASRKDSLESVACPTCGPSPSRVWMDDGKPTRYVRCQQCSTVFASPRAPYAKRYAWLDTSFGLGPETLKNAERRRPALEFEAAIIKRYIKFGNILDIGCDTGIFFEWFGAPEWRRFGVELSPSAAEYAAHTHDAQVLRGSIRDANLAPSFFDLVTMMDMLYYVDDPRADLVEVARVLKPDGILAIEFPGQAYQLLRSRGLLCWLLDRRWTRLHTDSTYLFWFTFKALSRLLVNCGFKVILVQVIGSPTSSRTWRNNLAVAYYSFANVASGWTSDILDWAPKYLVLARRTT